ncbi:MAG: TonB-dependent receptor [Chlorobi bacterium]|nr:TonB-dependent receptor [Chlorobiota bacterium]
MGRVAILLLTILFDVKIINAQYIVSGKVKDSETKEPISGVMIQAFNQADSSIAYSFSDEKGNFSFDLKKGIYTFYFSLLGFQPETLKTVSITTDKFLGVIYLKPKPQTLKQVEIKVNELQQLNKQTYRITDSLRMNAPTTKEILAKLPTVTYNAFDQSITVEGSQNILFMVNGVPKPYDVVKNIPSSQIEKIEIVTDPTGRYALQGYTAIVNIITKKVYKGYNVSLGTNPIVSLNNELVDEVVLWAHTELFSYIDLTYNNTTVGLVSNYIKEKFPFYSYLDIKTPDGSYRLEPINTSFFEWNRLYGNVYLERVLKNASRIGLSATYTDNLNSMTENLHFVPSNDTLLMVSQEHQKFLHNTFFYQGFVNYRWKIDIQPEFSITHNMPYYLYTSGNNSVKSSMNVNYYQATLSVDNNVKVTNSKSLSFGAFADHRWSTGKVTIDSNETQSISDTVLFKWTNAYAHLDYSVKLQNKLSVMTGFHVGLFSILSQKPKIEILPMIKIKYDHNNILSVLFLYRMRRRIPEYTNFFGSQYLGSNFIIQLGNPNLKPYFSHYAYLKFLILNFITIKPYVTYAKDYITQLFTPLKDHFIVAKPVNAKEKLTYGIYLNFPVPLYKEYLILLVDADLYKTKISAPYVFGNENLLLSNSRFMKWIQTSLIANLSKAKTNLILQANIRDAYQIAPQKTELQNISLLLFIVNKSMWKDRLNLYFFYVVPVTFPNLDVGFILIDDPVNNIYLRSVRDLSNLFVPRSPVVGMQIVLNLNKGYVKKTSVEKKIEEPKSKGAL